MTRTRYRIWEKAQPHFLTCTAVAWLPIFARPEAAQIVLDSCRFLQAQQRLTIFGYVIMENHLHLIASAADLSVELKSFKSFTGRQIAAFLEARGEKDLLEQLAWNKTRYMVESRYQVWQEGNHPQLIKDEEMMYQKLEYMHNNPVRRGYIDDPVHWR